MQRKMTLTCGSLMAMATLVSCPALAQPQITLPTAPIRYLQTPQHAKPRIVVTTDPELDDANSMIRYLLYASDFNTVGLVYASSAVHWSGDMKGTRFALPNREYSRPGVKPCPCTSYRWPTGQLHIDRAIDAYAKVYANLKVHDPGYPAPDYLRSIVRWGNTAFEGDIAHDSAGSDLIRELLLDDAQTPVYLLAWGGESTIARALKSIELEFGQKPDWPTIKAHVTAKAVIVPMSHQDDTYETYIKPVWPQIRYQERADGVPLGYGAQSEASLADAAYFSAEWTRTHVLERGPMGALYRVWGDGLQMMPGDPYDHFGERGKSAKALVDEGFVVWTPPQEESSFISEGDTPTFLDFIGNGLDGFRPETPGGWGGHQMTEADKARMAEIYAMFMKDPQSLSKLPRRADDPFTGAAQHDFAARLAWSVAPTYAAANHNPAITLKTPATVTARRGQVIPLGATASDPDGDEVAIRWRRWKQADDYPGDTLIADAVSPEARFRVPRDAKVGQVFQIIAEAIDSGSPNLSRYAKVLVTVVR
jgi:hypothetical protein